MSVDADIVSVDAGHVSVDADIVSVGASYVSVDARLVSGDAKKAPDGINPLGHPLGITAVKPSPEASGPISPGAPAARPGRGAGQAGIVHGWLPSGPPPAPRSSVQPWDIDTLYHGTCARMTQFLALRTRRTRAAANDAPAIQTHDMDQNEIPGSLGGAPFTLLRGGAVWILPAGEGICGPDFF